jgi:hypothetical protein
MGGNTLAERDGSGNLTAAGCFALKSLPQGKQQKSLRWKSSGFPDGERNHSGFATN